MFNTPNPTSIATEAQGIDAATLGVNLGTEQIIVNQLRAAAGELVIGTQEKSLNFDISDVGPGLDAIDACAERLRAPPAETADTAAEPEAAPEPAEESVSSGKKVEAAPDAASAEPEPDGSPASPPAAPPADSPEEKAEAAGFTTSLLLRAGYPGHVILTGDDVPQALKDRDAAWKIGDVIGMTDVVQGLTTAEIKEQVIRSDTEECGGTASSEDIAASAAPDVAYFLSFCDGPETDIRVYYLVVPRDSGGHYSITLFDVGEGAAARPTGQKMFDTARGG
jgi:hypothetical protein